MAKSEDGQSDGQQPAPTDKVTKQPPPAHRRVVSQATAIPIKDTVYLVSIILTGIIVFYTTVGGLGRRIGDLEARSKSRGLINEYLDDAVLHKQVNALRLLEDEIKYLVKETEKRKGRPTFNYFKPGVAAGMAIPPGIDPNQEYVQDSLDLPAGFETIMLPSILLQDQHFRAIANEDLVARVYQVHLAVSRYNDAIMATHMPPMSDPRSLPRILPGTTKERAEEFADIAAEETSKLDGLLAGLPEMLRSTRQRIAARITKANTAASNP